jgi:predicted metal-dependent hydrolase
LFGRRRTVVAPPHAVRRGEPVELPIRHAEPVEAPIKDRSPRDLILDRVAYWSERMDARHRRVFVKDQRTLWGSCSARGNLNFNWRLTLAPREILDYVVVHELAHLTEMNHSKRFWAIVERWCPDYKERRRWLRKNGGQLLRKRAKPV